MIDDDVISRVVQLHDHIQAPPSPGGADVARGKRLVRRRRAASAVAATALGALTFAFVQISLTDDRLGQVPAEQPSGEAQAWSLERIRAEGSPRDARTTESGITTRAFVVCDGPPAACENDPPLRVPHQHVALEVTQGGRTALFDLGATARYWAADFDADSLFVVDEPLVVSPTGFSTPQQLRHRLLRADGSAVQLKLLDDPAPAIPGPGLFVIDYAWYAGEDDGVEDVYLVDERAGTLRPLDVPRPVPPPGLTSRDWGPNVDKFLWFVQRDCRASWAERGKFQESGPECAAGTRTYMQDEWFPDGWLQPGRMALAERMDAQLFLHVTLDYGRTWRRVSVSGDDAIPDALRQFD